MDPSIRRALNVVTAFIPRDHIINVTIDHYNRLVITTQLVDIKTNGDLTRGLRDAVFPVFIDKNDQNMIIYISGQRNDRGMWEPLTPRNYSDLDFQPLESVETGMLPTRFPLNIVRRMTPEQYRVSIVTLNDKMMYLIGEHTTYFTPNYMDYYQSVVDAIEKYGKPIVMPLTVGNERGKHATVLYIHKDGNQFLLEGFDPNGWTSDTANLSEPYIDSIIQVLEDELPQYEYVKVKSYDACPAIGPQQLLWCERFVKQINPEIAKMRNFGLCMIWSYAYMYLRSFEEYAHLDGNELWLQFYREHGNTRQQVCTTLLGFLEFLLSLSI